MTTANLDVTEFDGQSVLWLESDRLSEYLDAYKTGRFSALGINTARGYRETNINFLKDCEFVRALHVSPGIVPLSLEPLTHLRGLRVLVVSGDCDELTLAEFPELEEFRGYWHPDLFAGAHACLRILDISEYKSATRDLTRLPELPRLRQLSLVQANIVSLNGISRLRALDRLELSHLRSLKSLHDVELVSQMRWLECVKCRLLSDVEQVVPTLHALVVLRLNGCPALSSLRFLDELSKLEEFRFVGTDVRDGDLTPLLRLKRVGFLPRRGFSHSPEEIDAGIAARSGHLER